jgi:hypothetical protein
VGFPELGQGRRPGINNNAATERTLRLETLMVGWAQDIVTKKRDRAFAIMSGFKDEVKTAISRTDSMWKGDVLIRETENLNNHPGASQGPSGTSKQGEWCWGGGGSGKKAVQPRQAPLLISVLGPRPQAREG